MLKKMISTMCATVLLLSITLPVHAQNTPLPENFSTWNFEDRTAWVDANIHPTGENVEQGLVTRNYEASATKRLPVYESGYFVADFETTAEWTIDGNGNIVQYGAGRINGYPSQSVLYIPGNNRVYPNSISSSRAKLMIETRFLEKVSGSSVYIAHVYFLNGNGTYEFNTIQ